MVYKLSKHMGLIFALSMTQAPVEVAVRSGSENIAKIVLDDTELAMIGLGHHYNKELFEGAIKAHLTKEHNEYDYRYSQAVHEYLPIGFKKNDKIEVQWRKTEPYCILKPMGPDFPIEGYEADFPQIDLTFFVYDKDNLLNHIKSTVKYEGRDLLEFYEHKFKLIFLVMNKDKVTHYEGSRFLFKFDIFLDEKSVKFFYKVRPLLQQGPDLSYKCKISKLTYAIKLAKISAEDSSTTEPEVIKSVKISEESRSMIEFSPDEKQNILDFLKSAGLLEPEVLPPEDLKSPACNFTCSLFC